MLGLSVRPHNALMRAGINTVGQLVSAVITETVREVRNIGERSYREILDRIEHVTGMDIIALIEEYQEGNHEHATGKPTQLDPAVVERIESRARQAALEEALSWLIPVVRKHVDFGLLHPRIAADGWTLEQLLNLPLADGYSHYRILLQVLTPFSVADDLQSLVESISLEYLKNIVIPRYGLAGSTLQEVGDAVGLTRERIRQLAQKAKRDIRNHYMSLVRGSGNKSENPVRGSTRAKLQTALLVAEDLGLQISYSGWKQHLDSTGLMGTWPDNRYSDIDVAEALIAVCRLLDDECPPGLRLPQNLVQAINLASKGLPDCCANDPSAEDVPKALRRLIEQVRKHCGAVSVRWLSRETELDCETVMDALGLLGHHLIEGDWYAPQLGEDVNRESKDHVFHRALRKMFQYCGPLDIEQIVGGLRKATYRKQFPIPPPRIVAKVLLLEGYACEEGLYYWNEPSDASLSASEQVIRRCLAERRWAAHHDELSRAFLEAGLSLAALYAALKHSPLFERIDPAVYALRGTRVASADVQRARSAGTTVPSELEITYESGCVVIRLNLGAAILGTGSMPITSRGFPNLDGDWTFGQASNDSCTVSINDARINGLGSIFSSLGIEPGDRVELRFSPRGRTVTALKVGGNFEPD